MARADLAAVHALSRRVHPAYPEDREVFAERLLLYPGGCFVCEDGRRHLGYAISHPWLRQSVPALNARLLALPQPGDTYYIHDIALAPEGRGTGHGATIVDLLKRHARENGFGDITLVAVNRSTTFWQRHGFVAQATPALGKKSLSYGHEAAYMVCRL